MKPELKELYEIKEEEMERVYQMMMDSFKNYVKLVGTFPDWDDRQAAIEMTLRYYGAFDFKYGSVYSLDDEINEVLMIMFSDEVDYSDDRLDAAGCDSEAFRKAAERLGEEGTERWWAYFEELDRTEAEIDIPRPHIYADFLCVDESVQGQGRGSRLIQAACRYADELGLPLMLFTNGEEDIRFYQKNGFHVIGVARSEEFGLENTYVLYEPKAADEPGDGNERG